MAAVKEAQVRVLAYNATNLVMPNISRSEKWLAAVIEIPYINFTENVVDLPRKIDRNRYKTDNLLSLKVDNKVVYCNE